MDLFEQAREYAAEEEAKARLAVESMTEDQLRRECVSLMGMVAYYTKVEREMTKPRLHLEQIQKLLVKIKADDLLRQAADAEEQGVSLGIARVPAKPLVELLNVLREITRGSAS
jgi:hypothetical protein